MKQILLMVIFHFIPFHILYIHIVTKISIPVVERSKAWVYGRLPAELVGSKPAGGIVVCLL
jgi:hypothetical protein